jgi:Rieske [2Fe-2S] domain
LIKTRDGYRLLSRVCPHQGGTVEDDGGQFVCHNHGYQYDKDGGKCLNAEALRMKSYVVNVKAGRLIALVPDEKACPRKRAPRACSWLEQGAASAVARGPGPPLFAEATMKEAGNHVSGSYHQDLPRIDPTEGREQPTALRRPLCGK